MTKTPLPCHKRFFSTVGDIISGLFSVFFYGILPFIVAVVVILGFLFLCAMVVLAVARALGYDVNGREGKKWKAQGMGEVQSEEDGLSDGDGDCDGSRTGEKEEGSGEGTKVDEKTKLRVNIDMLEGILKAQKERLEELNKN